MKSTKKHEKARSGKDKTVRCSLYSTFFMVRFTAEKIDDESKLINAVEKRSIKAEINYEKGSDNGIEHYQFVYKTKSSKSLIKEREFWKSLFPSLIFPKLDYLNIAADSERCFEYCVKEDKTFVRHVFSKGKDESSKSWKGYEDIMENYELYYWQKDIVNIITGKICPRTIYNYYGDYDIGKTDFCKHLSIKYGMYLLEGPHKHVLDEVSKVYKEVDMDYNAFCWSFAGDEEHDRSFFITLEKVKDMYFTSHHGCNKEKRMVIGNRPHLMVFSNKKLDLRFCKMDHDRIVFREIFSGEWVEL
jgi:hypothetical protein